MWLLIEQGKNNQIKDSFFNALLAPFTFKLIKAMQNCLDVIARSYNVECGIHIVLNKALSIYVVLNKPFMHGYQSTALSSHKKR